MELLIYAGIISLIVVVVGILLIHFIQKDNIILVTKKATGYVVGFEKGTFGFGEVQETCGQTEEEALGRFIKKNYKKFGCVIHHT